MQCRRIRYVREQEEEDRTKEEKEEEADSFFREEEKADSFFRAEVFPSLLNSLAIIFKLVILILLNCNLNV